MLQKPHLKFESSSAIAETGPAIREQKISKNNPNSLKQSKVRKEGPEIDTIKSKVATLTPGGTENAYNTTKHSRSTHTKSRMTRYGFW